MDMPAPDDRVTLHLKTNRHVRDRLLGALRAEGITMQDFFEHLMQLLVTQPERIQEIKGSRTAAPHVAKKRAGRPPQAVQKPPRKLRPA
jgi:hypothetical protein